MKNICFAIGLFVFTNTFAQSYISQSMKTTLVKAKFAELYNNYGFENKLCFLTAFLNTSGEVSFENYFTEGQEYMIIGGGDEDAIDVDLRLMSQYGSEIVKDQKTDNTPIVYFKPTYSGKYTIKLKLFSCKAPSSFCSLAIMRKGANSVPVDNLDNVVNKMVTNVRLINSQVKVNYLDESNQWCAYGMILSEGDYSSITNIAMGSGNRMVLSSGDYNIKDLDLALLDTSGNSLAKDDSVDPNPLVIYRTSPYNLYGVKVKNYASAGKSFVMTTVLKTN